MVIWAGTAKLAERCHPQELGMSLLRKRCSQAPANDAFFR
ncbi:MAG: hypothetical protein JWP25_5411 [Bradyrhizobium sp.]|nr:hypothetical protein [Bradyrhizobium sp.]